MYNYDDDDDDHDDRDGDDGHNDIYLRLKKKS
jgi:hypothetical protein